MIAEIRATGSPNDRILVVYGIGHAKLLNQFARESGFYNVESPLKYLENKSSFRGLERMAGLSRSARNLNHHQRRPSSWRTNCKGTCGS
ncbi:MAG: DUF5694 domain-containing protein [Pyrinomonadaceae bacterium]